MASAPEEVRPQPLGGISETDAPPLDGKDHTFLVKVIGFSLALLVVGLLLITLFAVWPRDADQVTRDAITSLSQQGAADERLEAYNRLLNSNLQNRIDGCTKVAEKIIPVITLFSGAVLGYLFGHRARSRR